MKYSEVLLISTKSKILKHQSFWKNLNIASLFEEITSHPC